MGLAKWIPKAYPWRVVILIKMAKMTTIVKTWQTIERGLVKSLNEITRGAPCKVAKLMKMVNLIN